MSTHEHTIKLNAKADTSGISKMSGELNALNNSVAKVNKSLKQLGGAKLSINVSGAMKQLDSVASKSEKVSKSLGDISSKGFNDASGGASKLEKSVEGVESTVGSLSKSMEGISSNALEGLQSQISSTIQSIQELDSSFSNFKGTLSNTRAQGIKTIGEQAAKSVKDVQSLSDAVASLQREINSVDADNLNFSLGGSGGSGGYQASSGSTYNTYSGYGRRMGTINTLNGASLLSYLGLGTSLDTIFGTSMKKETNAVTSGLKGYDVEHIDEATNNATVSMQAVIPAMNAIQTATGATSDQMDGAVDTITEFGTYVNALTGSSVEAENAMFDLSKGIKGAFASLDQYGLTDESVKAAGWSGDASDFEGYMNAVQSIVGDTDEYMDTLSGQITVMGKQFSAAGGEIGAQFLPYIESAVGGFNNLNKASGGAIAKVMLIGFAGLSAIKPLSDTVFQIRQVWKGLTGLTSAWKVFTTVSNNKNIFEGLKAVARGTTVKDAIAEARGGTEQLQKMNGGKGAKPGRGDYFNKNRRTRERVREIEQRQAEPGRLKQLQTRFNESRAMGKLQGTQFNQKLQKKRASAKNYFNDSSFATNFRQGYNENENKFRTRDVSKSLKNSMSKAGGSMTTAFAGIGDSLAVALAKSSGKLKNVATNLGSKTASYIQQGITGVKNVFSPVTDAVTSLASTVSTTFKTISSEIEDVMSRIASTITSKLTAVGTEVQTRMSSLASIITSKFNAMTSIVTSRINSIVSAITTRLAPVTAVFDAVGNKAVSTLSRLTAPVVNLGNQTATALSGVGTSAIGLFSSMGSRMTGMFTGMASATTGIFSTLSIGLTGMMSGTMARMGVAMSGFMGRIGGVMGRSLGAVSGVLGRFVGGGVGMLGRMTGMLSSMMIPGVIGLAAAFGVATLAIHKMGYNWGDVVNMFKRGDTSALVDSMNEGIQHITDKLSSIDWGSTVQNIMSGLGQILMNVNWGQLAGSLLNAFMGILSGLGGALVSLITETDWGAVASAIWNGIKTALGSVDWGALWEGLKSGIGSIWDSFTNWLFGDDEGDDGQNLGQKILSWIWNGIKWAISNLGSLAVDIAGDIINSIFGTDVDVSGALSWLADGFRSAIDDVKQVLNDAYDWINDKIGTIMDIAGKITDAGKQVWDKLTGKAGDDSKMGTGQKQEGGVSKQPAKSSEAGKDATTVNQTEDTTQIQVDTSQAEEQLNALNQQLTDTMNTLDQSITTAIDQMNTTMQTMFTDMGTQLQTIMMQLSTQVTQLFMDMTTQIQPVIDGMITGISTSFTNMITDISTQFSQMFTDLSTTATTFLTDFNAGLTTANQTLMIFDTTMQDVIFQLQTISTTVTTVDASLQTLSANVLTVNSSFQQGFSGIGSTVSNELSTASSKIDGFKSDMIDKMRSAATDSVQAFQDGFTGLSDAISTEMDGAISTLKAKGDEMIAEAQRIGNEVQDNLTGTGGMGIGSPGLIWTKTEGEMAGTLKALKESETPLVNQSASIGQGVAGAYLEGATGSNRPSTAVITAPTLDISKSNNTNKTSTTGGSDNGKNKDNGGTIVHNWNITGEFDSEKRVDDLVDKITRQLTFENSRAGRTVGTVYKG